MANLNLSNPLIIGNTTNNFPNQTDIKKQNYMEKFLVSYKSTDKKNMRHSYIFNEKTYFLCMKYFKINFIAIFWKWIRKYKKYIK